MSPTHAHQTAFLSAISVPFLNRDLWDAVPSACSHLVSSVFSPRAAAKTYVKPPSLANLDKVNSNSLDLPSSSELHPPHAAKLQDLHPAGGHLTPCFSPSPAPILNINSASFSQGLELMGGFSVPKEGRMYPKLSGLHRSMESLQMPMSLPSAFSGGSTATPSPAAVPPASTEEEEEAGELGWSGSPRLAHLDRYGQGVGSKTQPHNPIHHPPPLAFACFRGSFWGEMCIPLLSLSPVLPRHIPLPGQGGD